MHLLSLLHMQLPGSAAFCTVGAGAQYHRSAWPMCTQTLPMCMLGYKVMLPPKPALSLMAVAQAESQPLAVLQPADLQTALCSWTWASMCWLMSWARTTCCRRWCLALRTGPGACLL